jgi:GDP-mannose 6-dehydrogenase
MQVSIFGLGYVGSVAAGCLAEHGHDVVGVDINPLKVELVKSGTPPVDEPGLEERFDDTTLPGSLSSTSDAHRAIERTDLSIVAVGTPLDGSGQLSTTNLYNIVDSTVEPLRRTDGHTFVIRSTVPPGTTRQLKSYLKQKLEYPSPVDFVVNPEFIREGTAVQDFYDPPYVVLGCFDGDGGLEQSRALYDSLGLDAEFHVVEPELAESLKFVGNTFHALKITFANEVSSIASEQGIDGKRLMDLLCTDEKLNISSSYMEPGMSFGGSCLPKDNQAFADLAADAAVEAPLVESIQVSNATHLERIASRIEAVASGTVGIVGVSFKPDTTDMRNSPAIELMRHLDGSTQFFGDGIDLSTLVGSNRDYVDRVAPDLESRLHQAPDKFVEATDTVVFTNPGSYPGIVDGLQDHVVCDPVGTVRDASDRFAAYHPVIW